MKVIFLGTSSGWPLPRLGCKCKICTSKDVKDIRLRPSIIVNGSILIDAPPDIYTSLKKNNINPSNITDLFITHAHDDHIMGIFDLSRIYNKNNKIRLLTSKGIFDKLNKRIRTSLMAFKSEEILPFQKIIMGKKEICQLIPVEHGVEAYGIKIKGAKPLLYAPEFRRILPSSKKELGDIDLVIIDGSSKTNLGRADGHETIQEGIRLGNEINAKKIIFTNIGHITDTHKNLEEFVKKEGGHKFNISYDGMEINI